MTLDAYGWPALDAAAMAKRRKWLARPNVLWGQMNWIYCPPGAVTGPPVRLPHKEYRDDDALTWQPDGEDDDT